jgi:hypothetical protein
MTGHSSPRARLPIAMLAVLTLAAGPPAAEAAPGSGRGPVVEVQTVPAVAGMRFSYKGSVLRADRLGRVRVSAPAQFLQRDLKVVTTRVSRGVRARLDRWYPGQRIVALAFYHRVRPAYVDLQGKGVDPKLVASVTVKGVHGGEYTFTSDQPRWLQVSRVVPKAGGRLRSKSLEYSVQKAVVRGSNVVNAGQQRFRPSKTSRFPIQLLLYSARFKTRDAFFGFPIGSAVRLEYPNGRVERHELAENGEVLLPSLPRSDYEVKVDAPGFSFSRPVSLSRDQEVELEVLSYLDIGLTVVVVVAFLVGLPLIRRPFLRWGLRGTATAPAVQLRRRSRASGDWSRR